MQAYWDEKIDKYIKGLEEQDVKMQDKVGGWNGDDGASIDGDGHGDTEVENYGGTAFQLRPARHGGSANTA